jgi:RHS repeat-associated protein
LRHAGTGTTLPTSGTAALYYHRNQQYSIVGLSDAAGTLVERYAYTAYGELTILAPDRTARTTSSFQNRYTYTGREWDAGLSLYYFRARWLDPKAGRFIGRDPLGYVDGLGLYGAYFVPNKVDPEGEVTRKVCCTFDNGSKVWNWTMNANPSQTAAQRCEQRATWGLGSDWKIASAREGGCDEPERDLFFVKFDSDYARNCGEECVVFCGGAHVDLHSKNSGELLVGIYGPGKGAKAKKKSTPRDQILRISTDKNRTLKFGMGAGKSCAKATDAEIADCVSKTPLPIQNVIWPPRIIQGKGGMFNNCQTHVKDAATNCCLDGFRPLAIPGRGALDPFNQMRGIIMFTQACGPMFPR